MTGHDDPHEDHEQDEHHHHHEHRPIDYAQAIEQFRADKDAYYRTGGHSPIPEAERRAFSGLPYYAVDPALRFEGRTLVPYTGDEPSDFQIPTSDGKLRPALRAGTLALHLDGQRRALTAYTLDGGDDESLFVPFLDSTSGAETYAAGRYLDLDLEADGTYTLDFNLAYHPNCVYDPRFSCALTPPENRLPVRIEAGERLAPGALKVSAGESVEERDRRRRTRRRSREAAGVRPMRPLEADRSPRRRSGRGRARP